MKTPALPRLLPMLLLALLAPTGARAATYAVATVAQLDAAVASAQSGDTIAIAAGTYNLDQGFVLRKSITVAGAGAGRTVLDGEGGQPFNVYKATVALSGLTLQDGRGDDGGAVANEGTVTLTDCALVGNTAAGDEGGGALYNGGTATLTDCVLSGNTALANSSSMGIGGAILNGGGLTMTGCTLSGNTAASGSGGGSGGGGAINNQGGSVTLTGCTLSGNTTAGLGGALLSFAGMTLTGCTLSANSAASGGAVASFSTLTLTDCALSANSATSSSGVGGALYNASTATLADCLLVNNTSSGSGNSVGAGAVYNSRTLTLTGCTFSGNSAPNGVVGALRNDGTATLTDDILYGDTAAIGTELANEGTLTFSYCDVQGYNVAGDTQHNFNADPRFVNAAAGDYRLQPGSPCLGKGTTAAPDYQSTDITGAARPSPPALGAYEADPAFATATGLSSSLNPSDYGQSVTLTVTVTATAPGSPVPTGAVTLSGLPGGARTLTLATVNGQPQASYTTSTLPSGTYALTASYTPAAGFAASSAGLTQTVLVNDRTMLGSSLNPSAVGQSVTFTATVDTEGGPAPAGSVSFYVDGSATPAATVAVSGTTASYATSALSAGAHTVTATFTGAGFVPSTSAALTQTVLALPTANSQSASVAFGTAKGITLTGSDPNSPPQSLTYSVATGPAHGTLSGTAPSLTYTPAAGYVGPDSFTFTASNGPGTSAPATVTLNVAGPTISGTVTLSGWLGTGEPTPQLTFTLTPAGQTSGGTVTTLTPTATSNASAFTFALTGITPGAYTLGVKGALWLREDAAVNVSTASASGANVTLPPGDVNGDNVVDGNDTALLRLYFNTVSGRSGFNASADLNGDGVVDGNDTALLRANFNTVGRPY